MSRLGWLTLRLRASAVVALSLVASCGKSVGSGAGTAGTAGSAAGRGGTGGVGSSSGGTAGTALADGGAPDAAASSAGASDASDATDSGPVPTPYVNYQVTGSWPTLFAGTAARPIRTAPGALKYRMVQVHDQFLAESCSIADYDKDGIPDLSSGRRWYEGPDFKNAHVFRDGHEALPRVGGPAELLDGVSDDQADYPFDMDGDGWPDIINIASPAADTRVAHAVPVQAHGTAYWYQNPGNPTNATDASWTSHLIHADVRLLEHGLVDVDGDGKPEILGGCQLCLPSETKGYYFADWSHPDRRWRFQSITPTGLYPFPYGGKLNGIGMGDINGDGRPDLLERGGAWLQSPSGWFLGGASTSNGAACTADPARCAWVRTMFFDVPVAPGYPPPPNQGGSHMYAFDVDGDGLTDVVSTDTAYGFGISWYQQLPGGLASCQTSADAGAPSGCFVKHQIIASKTSADFDLYHDIAFSEIRAVQLVDMDGDGLPEIIAGKHWLAQPLDQGDPDSGGTPVLYVFKLVRETSPPQAGKAHFEPHLVNAAVPNPTGPNPAWAGGSGVGTQVAIGQINPQTDGIMDICVASKLGLFVYFGQ